MQNKNAVPLCVLCGKKEFTRRARSSTEKNLKLNNLRHINAVPLCVLCGEKRTHHGVHEVSQRKRFRIK